MCMCVHACLVFHLQSRTALCLRFTKFVKAHQMMTDDSLLVPLADLEKLSQQGGKAEASGTATPLVSGEATPCAVSAAENGKGVSAGDDAAAAASDAAVDDASV